MMIVWVSNPHAYYSICLDATTSVGVKGLLKSVGEPEYTVARYIAWASVAAQNAVSQEFTADLENTLGLAKETTYIAQETSLHNYTVSENAEVRNLRSESAFQL